MIHILLLLLWIVYSSIFGYCDAYYWFYGNIAKYKDSIKLKDLHSHYFISRSIVGLVFGYVSVISDNYNDFIVIKTLIFTTFYAMIFPFWHNGWYYTQRNNISPLVYKKRFWDNSSTSIAPINFSPFYRTLSFVLGVIGYFSVVIFWH